MKLPAADSIVLRIVLWMGGFLLSASPVVAQKVYPCDHRYGAVASWSQSTDVLVPASRYDAEMWGFKYNLALTVFDSPFSVASTTDKVECSQTGRLNWEVYFQTDRWARPDDYIYPEGYKDYEITSYPVIPDYNMNEWTEVGKHYFPTVQVGEKKTFKYPNHGQELYDASLGYYGYDVKSRKSGKYDVLSGLVEYHREWVKSISGRYPSCFSYRRGETGVSYAMKQWFLAGRNSSYNSGGTSRTAYGQSAITGWYLGFPNFYPLDHDKTICQPSSTRWWDSWNTLLKTPQFDSREEALSYCETTLQKTIVNGGWYNDFTHWHETCNDDLDVFFASQRNTIGQYDVFTGGYGDVMQHLFLRDAVKSISTSWSGTTCAIDVHAADYLEKLPLSIFSIPLSVQVDLSGTQLSGKKISSPDSPGIRRLAQDIFVVDVPVDLDNHFHVVHIEPTDSPGYLDFNRPTIMSISAEEKIMTVKTDKPTRLALFWTTQNAPDYTVTILCRSNTLCTAHMLDFNDPAILTYGGKRTWADIENGDIYIGAITETKQSVLSRVYHFGDMLVGVSPEEPSQFSLSQNYPNPFNISTILRYEIPRQAHVTLLIYSIGGQKIKTLVDSVVSPGSYTAVWSGDDDRGNVIGSGMYFCVLDTDTCRLVRKLMLMK